MSQDDGSDSEPELVVQPRGHWDKGVGVRSVGIVGSVWDKGLDLGLEASKRHFVAGAYEEDKGLWELRGGAYWSVLRRGVVRGRIAIGVQVAWVQRLDSSCFSFAGFSFGYHAVRFSAYPIFAIGVP